VSIASDNNSVTIVLSGNGVAAQTSYATILSWDLDDSATNGYNVYSGTTTGGPYTKLTSTPIAPNTYTDSSVQAGLTYYYVVTAIESDGAESAYSNEIAAQIP
jgi:fibronectin type 3 domain-containing protein